MKAWGWLDGNGVGLGVCWTVVMMVKIESVDLVGVRLDGNERVISFLVSFLLVEISDDENFIKERPSSLEYRWNNKLLRLVRNIGGWV